MLYFLLFMLLLLGIAKLQTESYRTAAFPWAVVFVVATVAVGFWLKKLPSPMMTVAQSLWTLLYTWLYYGALRIADRRYRDFQVWLMVLAAGAALMLLFQWLLFPRLSRWMVELLPF